VLGRRLRCPGQGLAAQLEHNWPTALRRISIHIGIGAEIFENLLPVFLVDQQVDALAAMAALDAALGATEKSRKR